MTKTYQSSLFLKRPQLRRTRQGRKIGEEFSFSVIIFGCSGNSRFWRVAVDRTLQTTPECDRGGTPGTGPGFPKGHGSGRGQSTRALLEGDPAQLLSRRCGPLDGRILPRAGLTLQCKIRSIFGSGAPRANNSSSLRTQPTHPPPANHYDNQNCFCKPREAAHPVRTTPRAAIPHMPATTFRLDSG